MKKLLYMLVLLIVATGVQAQEYMTLERARKLALSKSEDVKIAEATANKAEASKKAARTNYLPKISAEATGIYLNNDIEEELYLPTLTTDATTGTLTPNYLTNPSTGDIIYDADGNALFSEYAYLPLDVSLQGAYMAGVKLEQALFTGGKIMAGNKMADIGEEMATENIELKKLNTISEADQAFWIYVSVQSKVKLAESSLVMLDSLLQRVQNSYEAGLATRNDVLKVQVEYDNARLNVQKANSGLELSRMALCRVTGLDFNTPIVTDSTINITNELLQLYGSENVKDRPEYKLLEKQVAFEDEKVKTVRADYLPQIGVSTGYNYVGGIELNDETYEQGNFNVMASIKIPLFNWTEGKQKTTSAKVDKQIKEYELQKNTKLLQLEIEQAKLNLKDAMLRIQISESGLLQAEENLRISNDNYEVGRELLTDRLIAQTQWEKAYNEVIEAKTSYKLQETEYLRVTAKL